MIPRSLGNLSLAKLLDAWGSTRRLDSSEAAMRAECDRYVSAAHRLKLHGLEDLVGWGVVEPIEGTWDWSHYTANARQIQAQGLQYIAFAWPLILPAWAKHDDTRFPKTECLEHRSRSDSLSIFSDATMAAYDRYFAQLADALGDRIDRLRLASPYDFGETAYPAGCAAPLFDQRHIHDGYWCAETTHPDPDDRLTFLEWYHRALTDRMGTIVDLARNHFPHTPILLNYGWPFERPALGQDITGLALMAAAKGIELRCPWGHHVPFLYTKRVATAAKHAHLSSLSTEPANGDAPVGAMALSIFKILESGVSWHFDYEANYTRGLRWSKREQELWREGERPDVDVALFFPSWAHRLSPGNPGYPDGLICFAERLRAITDFDVIDEALLSRHALDSYKTLLWPTLFSAKRATVDIILNWVGRGGRLLCGPVDQLYCVDTGQKIPIPAHPQIVTGLGFDQTPWTGDLATVAAGYEVADLHGGWAEALSPRTTSPRGVLISHFGERILAFNANSHPVTFGKHLSPLAIEEL